MSLRSPVLRVSCLVAAVLVTLGEPTVARAGSRVVMVDGDLAHVVEMALERAHACRPAVEAAFGAPLPRDLVWRMGEPTVCGASGATSYVRRNVPRTVWVCRAFADEPPAGQVIAVLHESLHAAGIDEGHGVDGKDHAAVINRKLVEACGWAQAPKTVRRPVRR